MSGRTPEEREAARLERERRRAARGGVAPPVVEPPAPRAPAPAPAPATEVESAEQFVNIDLAPADEPITEHEEDLAGYDPPAGTRRVSALHRGRRDRQPPARTPRRRGAVASGRGAWRGRVGALVAIVLAAVLLWFLVSLFQPFHGAGGAPVRVSIPARLSSRQVGDLLAREGVVASGSFFELRATLAGKRGALRAGTYTLRRDESYGAALSTLTTPPPPAKTSELTVIEGTTRAQLSALLHRQGIRGDYLTATRRSAAFSPAAYGAPPSTPSLEGFLFPDTYQLRDPITAAALAADQLATFRRQIAAVDFSAARRVHLTPYDVLIIASLVQGEARTAGDRARIASVIYNRLRARMPLQIDATVRYATGNFTGPITLSQLHSRSAWNTYTHPGLPRTPINSPGLAAIRAAAHPARTNYLFFVVKPCGNGAHAFATTYAAFQVLEARYNAARTRRGGRSPEFCR